MTVTSAVVHRHTAERHSPAALIAFSLADGDIKINNVIAPGGGDAGEGTVVPRLTTENMQDMREDISWNHL